MRFPVFSRRSNPAVDRPILRKKMSYLIEQVESLLADWVDAGDHAKGIICRELVYFGPRQFVEKAKPADPFKLPPREVPGVYFEEPQSAQWKMDHKTVRFLPAELG